MWLYLRSRDESCPHPKAPRSTGLLLSVCMQIAIETGKLGGQGIDEEASEGTRTINKVSGGYAHFIDT